MVNSYISPKCEIQMKSTIHRYGVFAKEHIQKDELLAIWGGHIIAAGNMDTLPKEILQHDYPVQVYDNLYLGPGNKAEVDEAEMFNHSCTPNAGIKGSIILVARHNIEKGKEICFDYETTDIEGMNFLCSCNTKACRKIINGQAWMQKSFQRKNIGYMSWYIEEKIKQVNRSHWFLKKPQLLEKAKQILLHS